MVWRRWYLCQAVSVIESMQCMIELKEYIAMLGWEEFIFLLRFISKLTYGCSYVDACSAYSWRCCRPDGSSVQPLRCLNEYIDKLGTSYYVPDIHSTNNHMSSHTDLSYCCNYFATCNRNSELGKSNTFPLSQGTVKITTFMRVYFKYMVM